MKKEASPLQLNVTIRVSMGNPWIALIMVILGARGSDMLLEHSGTNAAPSPVVNVYQHNSSGACPMAQSNHDLIAKQMALWAASVAMREYEEAKGHVSPEQLELLRQKAEWLGKAASSYHLETMTGRKAPRH
ncbi:hypothetical protein Q7C30_013140 [Pseudomonas sp. RAC1]|uniref:hypothetical protein n=1 Tax=Pseudomonas sp. RAC1 TaxID=3064900 RepID=UPI00271DFD3E|nr:hypothetical protein [Pseudomonas sp. RAC1]MDV9033044.1 hypothetical protein [Pseudomonas sp. RAC1]